MHTEIHCTRCDWKTRAYWKPETDMQGNEITYWTDLEKVASDMTGHRKKHPGEFDLDLFKQKES